MTKVNPDLYDFLKENETGLFQKGNRVIGFVHIYFCDLAEFTRIVGPQQFDEGGTDVTLFENTVCVELDDIFEADGNDLMDYKNCFDQDELKRRRDLLKGAVD